MILWIVEKLKKNIKKIHIDQNTLIQKLYDSVGKKNILEKNYLVDYALNNVKYANLAFKKHLMDDLIEFKKFVNDDYQLLKIYDILKFETDYILNVGQITFLNLQKLKLRHTHKYIPKYTHKYTLVPELESINNQIQELKLQNNILKPFVKKIENVFLEKILDFNDSIN